MILHNSNNGRFFNQFCFWAPFGYMAGILVLHQQELLYAAQDLSGWQPGMESFAIACQSMFGLLEWLAGFATQLFYYPLAGIAMLLLLWYLAYRLLGYGLHFSESMRWMSILPLFGILGAITQVGYWIYTLRMPSYWLLPTCLFLWLAVTVALMRATRFWMGFPMLLLLTPWGQLPHWHPFEGDPEMMSYPIWGALAAVAVTVAVALTPWRTSSLTGWRRLFPIALLTAGITLSAMLDYHNPLFRAELRMQQAVEAGQWERLKQETDAVAATQRQPTRQMQLLAQGAALITQHTPTDTVTLAPIYGIKPQMRSNPPLHMAQMGGPTVYYLFGLSAYCYRWNFENATEYGFAPQRLRMMLRCALLNGEWDLARKYVRLLWQYPFQREWAESMAELIGQPEAIALHPQLGPLTAWQWHDNFLMFDKLPEKVLLQYLPLTRPIQWNYPSHYDIVLY